MRMVSVAVVVLAIFAVAGFAYIEGYAPAAAVFATLGVVILVLTRNFVRGVATNDPIARERGFTVRDMDGGT